MKQGTAEWFAARCGKVTASRLGDVIAKTKTGPSERRRGYMLELIAERLTQSAADHFPSQAMEWGTMHEGLARSAYEAARGLLVEEVGFVQHPSIPMAGASPDGLIGVDGILEIKCPTSRTHLENIMRGGVDPQYKPQIGWQLECTGRSWADFVSFDPRMPEAYQLYICRITREELPLDEYRAEVEAFLEGIAREMERLAANMRGHAA